jgi:MFS family permease
MFVKGPAVATEKASYRGAWPVLSMLCGLYLVSMMDRQILVLLVGPLKLRFGVSDVQIGMLVGTAFAIVYSFLGIPAARFVDSGNRKWLIVAGVVIWCCSTAASGFATTYLMLVLFRLGLAAGEAVLTPAAHSMIGDILPPEQRSLAASVYTAAGLVGGPLSFAGGALIIETLDRTVESGARAPFEVWQLALFVVAIPGFLLGLLFMFAVREPARSSDGKMPASTSARLVVRQLVSRKRLYAGLMLGATLAAGASYGINYWSIETLRRDFGWSAVQAGSAMGPTMLVAGVAGALLAPWISRRLRSRGRQDAVIIVSMGFTFVTMSGLTIASLQSDPWSWLVLLGIAAVGALGASSNIITAMQEVAPARMRGTFVALLYMLITLFGGGLIPVLVPWMGEMLASMGGTLSQALAYIGVAVSVLALSLFWWVRVLYGEEARMGFPTVSAGD